MPRWVRKRFHTTSIGRLKRRGRRSGSIRVQPFLWHFSFTAFSVVLSFFLSTGIWRGRRMKRHVYMQNLLSHSKVTAHLGQSLSEVVWSIPMQSWRLIQKVSDRGFIYVCFCIVAFPVLSLNIVQDGYIFFIAQIYQENGLFIHSAMAGGKSKDGGSVPKKGSR